MSDAVNMPEPGTRILCVTIGGVVWPDDTKHPLRGVVARVPDDMTQNQILPQVSFQFLPDEPDLSSNGVNNAREFDTYGWYVDSQDEWVLDDLVIEEEP
jgi:hypothetical protein